MNELNIASEDLRLAERLVTILKWDYKHGRATIFELERALIALERVSRKHDEALLKELGVWDSLEPIK